MATYVIFASWFEPGQPLDQPNPTVGKFDCYDALSFVEIKGISLADPDIVGKIQSAGRMPAHSMYEQFVEVLHIFTHEGNPDLYISQFFKDLQHPKKAEFSDLSLHDHWRRVPIFPEMYTPFVPK